MTNKERIEELKQIIEELEMTDLTDPKFCDMVNDIEYCCQDLKTISEYISKGYFIAIYDDGPEDSFTRYYTLLGHCTLAEANAILHELSNEDIDPYFFCRCEEPGCKQVTKEEYDKWKALADISDAYRRMKRANDVSWGTYDEVLKTLEQDMKKRREELGLQYRWEVVKSKPTVCKCPDCGSMVLPYECY